MTLFYVLLYGYLAFGLGYFIKRGLTVVNLSRAEPIISVIGTHEMITINIDYLFEELGIPQIDPIPE